MADFSRTPPSDGSRAFHALVTTKYTKEARGGSRLWTGGLAGPSLHLLLENSVRCQDPLPVGVEYSNLAEKGENNLEGVRREGITRKSTVEFQSLINGRHMF